MTGTPSTQPKTGDEAGAELQSIDWFPSAARPPGHSARGVVLRSAIGVAIGLSLILLFHQVIFGGIIIALSVAIGAASLASAGAKAGIDRFFAALGGWIGGAISWLLLAPLFLVGFTLVRGWMWVVGADPLQMSRRGGEASYWLQSDSHRRKLRYAGAMFASERLERRGLGLTAIAALLIGAVVLSEGFLRVWGYGDPILYAMDDEIGYYPAPNQKVTRTGGRIETNAFGMRSPDYPAVKAPGTFRILMIGDSTLYGGSYIDQEELYSRLLEGHLRSLAPGRRIEVMAIGTNSWGPMHEIGYVRRFGTFGADLAIVNLPSGDIYRPLSNLGDLPYWSASHPPRLALEEVALHLAWRYRTMTLGPAAPASLAARRGPGIAAYRELARMLRAGGAEVQLHVLPGRATGTGVVVAQNAEQVTTEQRDVADIRRAVADYAILDYPPGLFRGLDGRIYHDDSHLDVDGHRRYARHLSGFVASSGAWRRWLARPAGAAGAGAPR